MFKYLWKSQDSPVALASDDGHNTVSHQVVLTFIKLHSTQRSENLEINEAISERICPLGHIYSRQTL